MNINMIWLVVSTPLKNIRQVGVLFPIYGKIKIMFQTTNQLLNTGILMNLELYWHHIFRHLQGACCACSPCTAIARSANSTARVSRKAATRPPAKSNDDWENGRKKIANMGV
jgi:hypothetical protein